MRRFQKNRGGPVFTHALEEDLDKSWASLSSQLDLLEKLNRVFGSDHKNQDPVVRFQIKKMKDALQRDMRKLALSGTDLHHLGEQFGSEIVRGEILRARKEIASEKEGEGQLTDMVDDNRFAEAVYNLGLEKDAPILKALATENAIANLVSDDQRLALKQYYVSRGMDPRKAEQLSLKQSLKNTFNTDAQNEVLRLIRDNASRLPESVTRVLVPEEVKEGERVPELREIREDRQQELLRQTQRAAAQALEEKKEQRELEEDVLELRAAERDKIYKEYAGKIIDLLKKPAQKKTNRKEALRLLELMRAEGFEPEKDVDVNEAKLAQEKAIEVDRIAAELVEEAKHGMEEELAAEEEAKRVAEELAIKEEEEEKKEALTTANYY